MSKKLTLESFAHDAGFRIVSCGKHWGGTVGYQYANKQNITICGFRTERAARRHFLEDKFDKDGARALAKLIGEKI